MTIIIIIIIRETGMSVKSRQWFLLVAGAFKEPCSLSVHMIHTLYIGFSYHFAFAYWFFSECYLQTQKKKNIFFKEKKGRTNSCNSHKLQIKEFLGRLFTTQTSGSISYCGLVS